MTRSELERAVCRATGESRHTIRAYGFNLVDEETAPTGDPLLLVDCPGCGAPLDACHSATSVLKFIECPRCDAVYPFAIDEIYVSDNFRTVLRACA